MRTDASRRPLRSTVLLLPVALLLAACGGAGDDQGATASSSATVTTTPSPTAEPSASPSATGSEGTDAPTDTDADSAAPAFGTGTDGQASADARLTVTDLRTGAHDGYERVVIELGGTGTPGWHAEVSPSAVENPTGEVIELGGQAVLTVYLSGLGYPFETGQQELPANTVLPAVGTAVTGAAFTGTFEGEGQVFIGLGSASAEYRIFPLADPTRLVVDIRS